MQVREAQGVPSKKAKSSTAAQSAAGADINAYNTINNKGLCKWSS